MHERIYLLPEKGQDYKANLHSHTVFSDGHLTAEESKRAYMEQGYQVMAFTDHRVYHNHESLNEDGFVALAAYEVDINESRPDRLYSRERTYHINLYDTNPKENQDVKNSSICPECDYTDMAGINAYIKKMTELGFIACYNHPYWSLQNYDDYKGLEGFFAMEIYNYGCEHDGLYGYNPQSYDELLRLGKRIYCLATDDNHNSYPFGHPLCDSFGGFTMIRSERLSYGHIIEALQKGSFYSSMGPEIKELYIENMELVVKTGPVRKIYAILEGKDCYKAVAQKDGTITEARFSLKGDEGYIRIQCQDEKGLYANSNAYFLKDMGIGPVGI